MTPMFAQLETVPGETIKNFALIVLALLGGVYYAREIWFRKESSLPQPMNVEIVKALHEQFASKTEFEEHKAHNTDRHGQIFAHINRVEREAREALDKRFTALNEERAKTLVTLNTEFTFLRENVAAINREIELKRKQS